MAPRKNNTNIVVSEEFQIQTETIMRTFLYNENASSYEFPSALTNIERAWIHTYAKSIGLASKSHGKNANRKLTITKRKIKTTKDKVMLTVGTESVEYMRNFFNRYPVMKESSYKMHTNARLKQVDGTEVNMGQLTLGIPQLPSLSVNNELINFRMTLPIWPFREHIMEMIVSNQVILVCGETGSGKTTQIPQFILDYSRSVRENCRIICTQPRRISAVAVAERVANERAERTGQTVGFHIRLESCVSPKTSLIYCTNGILLRTLMNGDACLNYFTHIIVDEIHERDRFSDFLLICLRECLVRYPHLRLILMSATIDIKSFREYFNNAQVIHIPGRLYSVQEFFLDDILKMLKYESTAMSNLKAKLKKNNEQTVSATKEEAAEDVDELCNDLKVEMDECITECVRIGSDDSFAQLLQMILSEHVPVDFQHSETRMTALMAAALHGNDHVVYQLLSLGANVNLSSKDNYTAFDWACLHQHINIAQQLKEYGDYWNNTDDKRTHNEDESKQILKLYQSTVSETIDFDLLITLLLSVHFNDDFYSILVFFPGYDDIVTVKDKIFNDVRFGFRPYQIFTLHGLMQIGDQHKVFTPLKNKRKIILSTNISETSITIDDVVYVIDSGKVKEKSYDAMTGICTLQSGWISQSCAKQRAGRAGRTQPGYCFHLISKFRYESLQTYPTPEILRMPLHELCLQTKLLATKDTKILEFLSRAMDPPSVLSVANAVRHLQDIEALDENEQLTVLGQHLVDLPVQPHLAKILIYSVIFKCLDPILTIVAFLSYRDPFVLPNMSQQKNIAVGIRKQFADSTFSDHMILLRAFQAWQDARVANEEKIFCSKYFISSATMEMAVNIRSQLLAQLRASGFVRTRAPSDVRALNENGNNWAVVKAVLTAGFYPNVAYINKHSMQIRTKKEKKVVLHISSSLRGNERSASNSSNYAQSLMKIPSNWLIYEELSRMANNYNMRIATNITPLTVALFADETMRNLNQSDSSSSDSGETALDTLILDNWIMFEGSSELITFITDIRHKLRQMIIKRISNPMKLPTSHDDAVLQLLAVILKREDNNLGLHNPPGIGQRPKVMLQNNSSNNNVPARAMNSTRRINKKSERVAAEMVHFQPVHIQRYNKYIPSKRHIPKESTVIGTGSKETVEHFSYFSQPNTQYERQAHALSELSQNLDCMSLQTSFRDMSFADPVDDFQNNGVTIDMEGACALDPCFSAPTQMHQQKFVPEPFQFYPNVHKFIIIKAANIKTIEVSINKKSWVFSPQTEKMLSRLLMGDKVVMLIFTVPNSRCLQGLARLLAVRSAEVYSLHCPLEWLSRADITFDQIDGLRTRDFVDGEELEFNVGVKLYYMFTHYTPTPPIQRTPSFPIGGRAITKTPT